VRETLIEGVRDYLIVSHLAVRDCVIVSTATSLAQELRSSHQTIVPPTQQGGARSGEHNGQPGVTFSPQQQDGQRNVRAGFTVASGTWYECVSSKRGYHAQIDHR
jgi:hypothetical protein